MAKGFFQLGMCRTLFIVPMDWAGATVWDFFTSGAQEVFPSFQLSMGSSTLGRSAFDLLWMIPGFYLLADFFCFPPFFFGLDDGPGLPDL